MEIPDGEKIGYFEANLFIHRNLFVGGLLMEKITMGEYVAAEEEDDKGRKINSNPSFGNRLDPPREYYKDIIGKEGFLELYWQRNGTAPNEVNVFSRGTRSVKAIVDHFKSNKIISADILLEKHKGDYDKMKGGFEGRQFFANTDIEPSKRRLFLIREDQLRIYDGFHRAAALCTILAKDEPFEPVTIYVAEPSKHR